MSKKILLSLISFYQNFIHVFLKNIFGIDSSCRFEVTCSNYAKQSIRKYGALAGVKMTFVRILKCQPLYKVNYANS